jgi:hypothetical protein
MEKNLQFTFLSVLRALIRESYPECVIHENVVTKHTGFGFTVDEPSFCAERLETKEGYDLRIRTFRRNAKLELVESERRHIGTRLLIAEQALYDFVNEILPLSRPQGIPIAESPFAFLFKNVKVPNTK